jgi:hypothetical protein
MTSMKYLFSAILAGGLVASSVALAGSEPANTMGCLHMSKQVAEALSDDQAQQSQNYQTAREEQSNGRNYCEAGLFDKGLQHYAHALELLGKG